MGTFGRNLREIRKASGLSQEALAERLHSTKQVVSKYETDQRTPKVTVANEYAVALGVPLDFLMGSGPFEDWPLLKSERVKIVNDYKEAGGIVSPSNPHDWDMVDYIKFVADKVESVITLEGSYTVCWKEPPPQEKYANLQKYIENLWDRPELRTYLSLGMAASKEDVKAATRIVIAYMKGRKYT